MPQAYIETIKFLPERCFKRLIIRIAGYIPKNGFKLIGWNKIYDKNVREGVSEFSTENSSLKLNNQIIIPFWMGKPELFIEAIENGCKIAYLMIPFASGKFQNFST